MEPCVLKYLFLTKPQITDADVANVQSVLASGWLTEGPITKQFEDMVAKYVGAKYAVAVCNCTVALELALRAHGALDSIKDIKFSVLIPDFTHPATLRAVVNAGMTPTLCDVDPSTYNMETNPADRKFAALMPVSWGGYPIPYNGDETFFVEDAACSLGSSINGVKTGSQVTACFSFHPRKLVTTGEGGMVVTNDEEVADEVRRLKYFGRGNYKISDVNSALGLGQMQRIDEIIARRREMAKVYTDLLGENEFISPPQVENDVFHTYQTYAVLLKRGNRDRIIQHMAAGGIETQVGAYALHLLPEYVNAQRVGDLRNSAKLHRHLLALPMAYDLNEQDQHRVVNDLRAFVA